MFTPWGQAAGYLHPVPGLSAEGKRKRDKKKPRRFPAGAFLGDRV
jgi:hypothetical protein